jgi:hypothetical protein
MSCIFPELLNPAAYPDFDRRQIRVPTWDTFDNVTQFTTLRMFSLRDGKLHCFREDLDLYTEHFKLGRLVWPYFTNVRAENFPELVAEIKRRGLYLFDIWGHIPGTAETGGNGIGHVMPPPGMVQWLTRELGDHFLGFDNGEQDGRYFGGYAPQQCPAVQDRFAQYLNFQRFFQTLGDDMGNAMSALVSLCFGHYFLKENNHLLLGAETGQTLPSSQLYYAFIRGAGKQYGVLWFGNTSVYNRWGYKSYEDLGGGESATWGLHSPAQGASLCLLRRLIYSHILYNCAAVGFEQNWIAQDSVQKRIDGIETQLEKDPASARLSPLGGFQAAAVRWVQRYGQPGVMHAPVALLLGCFAGWAPPRHLYADAAYPAFFSPPGHPPRPRAFEVWGAMPYDAGDYLTHGVLSVFYPGYEDASYFHDERGFISPTPYGDIADVLLGDAPPWVLARYGLIVAAGAMGIDLELREKLLEFASNGGELFLTADNARQLFPEWQIGAPSRQPAGVAVDWEDGSRDVETHAFSLSEAILPPHARVLARCGDRPAVVSAEIGRGRIMTALSPFGLNDEPQVTSVAPVDLIDQALPSPFVLLAHARRAIAATLARQQAFSVGDQLAFIACRQREGVYTIGVFNNTLAPRPMRIRSHIGPIASIEELPPDDASVKSAVGYWPTKFQNNDGGRSDDQTIGGGDVRLFCVRLAEESITLLPQRQPHARPERRWLSVRGVNGLKESLLARPTFFQHFDGVKLDWQYLRIRDRAQLAREAGWLARQSVRIVVDLSSGVNFYPDLTLLDTLAHRYEQSVAAIDDVLEKMCALGAKDLILSLHRRPENNCDDALSEEMFRKGILSVCRRAAGKDIIVHLQHHPHKWRPTAHETLEFVRQLAKPNLRFALNVCHALMTDETPAAVARAADGVLGMILLSAPATDVLGQRHDAHRPMHEATIELRWIDSLEIPTVLDAEYNTWDEVYQDCSLLRERRPH